MNFLFPNKMQFFFSRSCFISALQSFSRYIIVSRTRSNCIIREKDRCVASSTHLAMAMGTTCKRDSNQKGSLLILVLFALATLSLMALSVGYTVHQKLEVVKRLEARENLRLAAEAAVHLASHEIYEKIANSGSSYQSLNQGWANNPGLWKDAHVGQVLYSIFAKRKAANQAEDVYGLTDENQKLNLNRADPQALQKLFELAANVDKEEARRMVAAIRDWVDEDDDLNEGGAESKDYLKRNPSYQAKNQPFQNLQELLWVQGMTPEIFEAIKPYLTLDATEVNVNTASEIILMAKGMDADLASKVVTFRKGKDGLEGTGDDGIFSSLEMVGDELSRYDYLSDSEKQNLEAILAKGFSVVSTFFTAEIEGYFIRQNQRMLAHVLLDREGKVHQWHEEFL